MGRQIPCQGKALRQMEEAPLFWGASNLMQGVGGGEEGIQPLPWRWGRVPLV